MSKQNKRRLTPGRALVGTVMLFYFLAFLLLGLQKMEWQCFVLAAVVPVLILFGSVGITKLYPADTLLLSLVNFLCALGVLVLYRLKPEYGMSQAVNYGVGMAAMIGCTLLIRYIPHFRVLNMPMMLAGLVLLAAPLVMGVEKNDARSWIAIGGFNFQPSEVVKVLMLICLSTLLARRKVIPAMGFAVVCVLILAVQNDFGTALVYFGTALALGYASTGSLLLVGAGVGGAAAAVIMGSLLMPERFSRAVSRVNVWLDPWADPLGKGYQLIQGLVAMVNGGAFGVGLGVGNGTVIPQHQNDSIFMVIVNEFGMIFGAMLLAVYLLIIIRGMMIAKASRTRFHALLAVGCAAILAVQTFVIIGGNIKLIPLTGLPLPFISMGGTAMVSSMCIIGIMQGVAARNAAGLREDRELALQGGDDL